LIAEINQGNYSYYHELKKVQMLKSKEPIHNQLEIYLNNLVDKKINQAYNTNLHKYGGFDSFAQSAIFSTIFNLNHLDTVRSFQKILNSPYTSNDAITKNLVRIAADNTTKIIATKETERVLKNLEYVERTLQQAKIDISKYNQIIKELSPTVSRKEILEQCLEEGKMYTGRDLSYKQMNNLAKDLERYKAYKVDYDAAISINREAIANGLPPVYTHKRWIWSELEKTRHRGMEGVTVELEEKFTVVNEVTGDIDYLLFPGDVENYSNPGQIINCGCDYEILTNDGIEYKNKEKENFNAQNGKYVKDWIPENNKKIDKYGAETVKKNKTIDKKDLKQNTKFSNNESTEKQIKSFQKNTSNLNHEVATIFDSKGNKLLDMHKGTEKSVSIPKNVIDIGKSKGLGLNIHNHPSQVPIPSKGDIRNFIITNSKQGIVTSKNNYSMTTIKDYKLANKKIDRISGSYLLGMDNVKKEFVKNNSLIVENIKKKYPNDPFKQGEKTSKEFKKYAQKNTNKIIKELNKELNRYGINIDLM
jgi:hypothetical protein